MQINGTTQQGAIGGALIGAGIGTVVGNKKAKQIFKKIGISAKTTMDEYVKTVQDKNLEKIISSNTIKKTDKIINKTLQNVAEKPS